MIRLSQWRPVECQLQTSAEPPLTAAVESSQSSNLSDGSCPQSQRLSGLRRNRKAVVGYCAGTEVLDRLIRSRPDPHQFVAAAQGVLAAVFKPRDNLGYFAAGC